MSQNPFASPRDVSEPALVVDFKDRSTGLLIFGILEIIMGLICAMAVPFMALGMLMSPKPMPLWTVVPALALYALVAVGFIWLGIGSIQTRRWARALVLAVAWPWLLFGVIAMAVALGMMPTMYAQFAYDGKIPELAIVIMLLVMSVFMVLFYIVLPAAFVSFYQSKHVKATCERKDPKPRWTDRCPQPVLTLALVFAFAAYSSFWSAICGGMAFTFGLFLRGWLGAAVGLGITVLCVGLAWGVYRLRMAAWWAALVLSLLLCVSAAVSSSAARWSEIYKEMGLSGDELASAEKFAGSMQPFAGWWAILGGLAVASYLLAIRRYFVAAASIAKRPEPMESPAVDASSPPSS